MGPVNAIPMSVALLMLCANPVSSGDSDADLRAAVDAMFIDRQEVVAASPVPAGIGVGSHYGHRVSRRTGNRTFHAGTDFLAPSGTPVYAVRAGVVETVVRERDGSRRWAGYGNGVVIRHDHDGRWSFYAHLSAIDVAEGDVVLPGHKLGSVGRTTNGRFPRMVSHLHFEVREARRDGESPFPGPYGRYDVNPEEWLADMGVTFDAHHDDDVEEPELVVRELPTELVADAEHGVASF